MDILRFFIHFFKTWFLPMPAHDDVPDQPGRETSLSHCEASTAPASATEDTPADSDDDAGDQLQDDPDDDDDDETPAVVPPHPISPPEGAEERASRTSAQSTRSVEPE